MALPSFCVYIYRLHMFNRLIFLYSSFAVFNKQQQVFITRLRAIIIYYLKLSQLKRLHSGSAPVRIKYNSDNLQQLVSNFCLLLIQNRVGAMKMNGCKIFT